MTANRDKLVVDKRLCYNCMGCHNMRQCINAIVQSVLCSPSHDALRGHSKSTQPSQALTQPSASSTYQSSRVQSSTHRPLETALTRLYSPLAQVHSSTAKLYACLLINSGSKLTFISEEVVSQLNQEEQHSSIFIVGARGKSVHSTTWHRLYHLVLCQQLTQYKSTSGRRLP